VAEAIHAFCLGRRVWFRMPGIRRGRQSGNRHCVECTIEVPVAGGAQSVSSRLAAAGLERGDTSQRGECGFAAETAAVAPADQKLGAATTGPRRRNRDRRRTRAAQALARYLHRGLVFGAVSETNSAAAPVSPEASWSLWPARDPTSKELRLAPPEGHRADALAHCQTQDKRHIVARHHPPNTDSTRSPL
jgi:hypothetical protein